ncbi:hypothetical protein V6N12_018568 [Hibiscus sabdariffa]|uniref:Uncharacterized protein n=1 Tax=Hibiscus sabdariffa TaxID=183260 RepID=A0ABR2BY85_9ROSI
MIPQPLSSQAISSYRLTYDNLFLYSYFSLVKNISIFLTGPTLRLGPVRMRMSTMLYINPFSCSKPLEADMETLAPNGTLTKFDAPLPPIRPLMPHLRSQDGMSFFSPTALFYIFLLTARKKSPLPLKEQRTVENEKCYTITPSVAIIPLAAVIARKSLQRDSVTAAADKAKRLAGDSRTEDLLLGIYVCPRHLNKMKSRSSSLMLPTRAPRKDFADTHNIFATLPTRDPQCGFPHFEMRLPSIDIFHRIWNPPMDEKVELQTPLAFARKHLESSAIYG